MKTWALSSARLERRSYMATRHLRRCLAWRPKLTGGRRFKSARAHFYLSLLFTLSIFLFALFSPYMLLTTFNFSPSIIVFIQKQFSINNQDATEFVFNCINNGCNFNKATRFGFKQEEINHLIDVRNFLNALRIIFSFSLFFSFLLLPFVKLHKKLFFSLILLFIFLLIFALINFNFTFDAFHKIFFKQNYKFPSSYLLIQLFPQEFFITCFIFSSLLSFVVILGFL